MKVIKLKSELMLELADLRSKGLSIGFVPTMGALHQGHISLVNRCIKENDVCVVSVFVNPTQFNNPVDLEKYPRTPEQDCEKLESAGCSIVFMPSVEEMYPETDNRQFDFGGLDTVMEGTFRPGHFNGVWQVVSRLFDAVDPDKAYFGEKDFQQVAIIRYMVKQENRRVEIIPCPIVRDVDGLALSSRNMLLTSIQREKAPIISRMLQLSCSMYKETTVENLKDSVIKGIEVDKEFKVEYMDIVDGNTLRSISSWDETDYAVGCVAVYCDSIRLIDNITYFNNSK